MLVSLAASADDRDWRALPLSLGSSTCTHEIELWELDTQLSDATRALQISQVSSCRSASEPRCPSLQENALYWEPEFQRVVRPQCQHFIAKSNSAESPVRPIAMHSHARSHHGNSSHASSLIPAPAIRPRLPALHDARCDGRLHRELVFTCSWVHASWQAALAAAGHRGAALFTTSPRQRAHLAWSSAVRVLFITSCICSGTCVSFSMSCVCLCTSMCVHEGMSGSCCQVPAHRNVCRRPARYELALMQIWICLRVMRLCSDGASVKACRSFSGSSLRLISTARG